jgi:hypothetical protein
MRQARQAATILNRPVETLLSDILTATLPSVEDVPESLQAQLTEMTWMEADRLWRIARHTMSEAKQSRLRELSALENPTAQEEQEREALRAEYGQITLKKARAYAILSLRGGKPLL